MKALTAIVILPALASSIAAMLLLVGPWMAWKYMGVNELICFGLFFLELIGTIIGAAIALDWIEERMKA